MKSQTERKLIFLEVTRVRAKSPHAAVVPSEMRFAAWCERCGAKVGLVQQNENFRYGRATGELHVRVRVGDALLICSNLPI